jgi:hypothetical protein
MNINKATFVTDGDNVRFSMPINKVDTERRVVSGFATLDNIDKQGDIVTSDASVNAFKKFRGNLREMHTPSAVGKVVSFKEDRYFDPTTKKFYKGVYVSAYVSKGAQDAWEKVLDGTYTGFSIGGSIQKFDDGYSAELDKSIRIIKEYELHELSLVDNPANQFANVISIEKVDGQNTLSGFLSKADVDNVYWCSSDDIVQISDDEGAACPSCADKMQNIGFVENSDAEMVKFLVDSAKGIVTIKKNEEVSPMTEETVAVEETAVENVEVAPEAQPEVAEVAEVAEEVVAEEVVEKSVSPEEDSAEKVVAEEVVEEDGLEKSVSEIKQTVADAFGDLAATVKSLHEQIAALSKSLDEVSNEVSTIKGNFNEFGKRVDAVEADTAFRKSGDLGEIVQEPEMVQKSLWGGRFLKTADLFK